jgi:hypothetical protein
MTPPENGKPLWDESRVETLLEEFFRREIPAPLRGQDPARLDRKPLESSSASVPVPNRTANSRANSKTGGLMVGITLMLMLMVGILVFNPAPHPSQDSGLNTRNRPNETSNSKGDERDEGVLESLEHNGQGPIELRPRTQSVGTDDPENPAAEKSPFPELDVEVYPLDGDSPARNGNSRKSSGTETPMPEEGRELPESQVPAVDRDEARLDRVLPELRAFVPESGRN